jgi:hypothetical protein
MRRPFKKRYEKLLDLIKKLAPLEERWRREVQGKNVADTFNGEEAHRRMNMLRAIAINGEALGRLQFTGTEVVLDLVRTPEGHFTREFNFVIDELAPALDCDMDRVRLCTVCKGLFVANRKDKRACNPRCANVLRQRNLRSEVKIAQAAANRKRRKAVPRRKVR